MSEWPPIEARELLERLALSDAEFGRFVRELFERLPPRTCGPADLERALAYPWERPAGSYLLAGGAAEPLAALAPATRERALERFTDPASGRLPLLAIGSNAAPAAATRKFAHFADPEDRALLVLDGRLHDFDVGVSAHPALYGSLPATLFPSPGTAVRAALLWVTPAQFTQLTWTELSYRLGRLRSRFELDGGGPSYDEVLVFVSRFGTLSPQGEPVALAAVPADDRSAPELSQEQLLDAAAALALGPGARAAALVQAVFERPGETMEALAAVRRAALPFASAHWTPYPAQDFL